MSVIPALALHFTVHILFCAQIVLSSNHENFIYAKCAVDCAYKFRPSVRDCSSNVYTLNRKGEKKIKKKNLI